MYSHGMANPVGIRTFAGKEKSMKYIYYFLLVLWFIPASAQKVKRQDIWKASDW